MTEKKLQEFYELNKRAETLLSYLEKNKWSEEYKNNTLELFYCLDRMCEIAGINFV